MANPRIYGPAARRRIDRAVMRDEARIDGREQPGPPAGDGPLPRTYRHFTLTSELSANEDGDVEAEVEWDDGTTGVVKAPDKNAWGLAGESGEAAACPDDDDGVQWRVTMNPGQPVYEATANGDISGGATTAAFSVEIEGETRTVQAAVNAAAVTSGSTYSQGNAAYIACIRGVFTVVSWVSCES